MKANQNFRREEEAVSPVIGVILMVAITVVLAAVVFVLVQDLGGGSQETQPSIAFSKDENKDRLTVARADPDVNWDEFEIKSNETGNFHYARNADASASTSTLYGNFTGLGSAQITGADYFDFCHDGGGASNVVITILHVASNSQVYETTFRNIGSC